MDTSPDLVQELRAVDHFIHVAKAKLILDPSLTTSPTVAGVLGALNQATVQIQVLIKREQS